MGKAGFLDAFVEEGEVDVDPGDEVEEVGAGPGWSGVGSVRGRRRRWRR